MRMSKELFDLLLSKVEPHLTKQCKTREPIPAGERLTCTLRFLASGDSMTSISYAFRLGKSTVTNIIRETCLSIWDTLKDEMLGSGTIQDWEKIAEEFMEWHLPHCCGAIDGKHVVVQAFPKSGSEFFNYKKTHSLVLLAMRDAKYKFTVLDIGGKGKQSDGGIFRNSLFGQQLLRGQLNLPHPKPLEYGGENIPYFIACDEAFPLTVYTMRPYPGHYLPQLKRIFNYRLCRARRVIENSFGILCSRWRLLRKSIIASIETVEAIIQATVCLHNFIMQDEEQRQSRQYCPPNFVETEDADGHFIAGAWRQEAASDDLVPIPSLGTSTYSKDAGQLRESLALYCMTDGAVAFQWNKLINYLV